MSKLGLLDQMFYKLETNGMPPAYMGGAMILDPSECPYPIDGKMIADHIAARMEQIPLMRQKLIQDPLKIGDMQLVDDPDFNARNHITRTALTAPGGYEELTECLGKFSAQRLDLERPLWHYEVIEGLEGGCYAAAMHLHHSILDGIGAREALSSIWSTEPVAVEQPSEESWRVEDEPSSFELLQGALTENAKRLYMEMPSFLIRSGAPIMKATFKALTNAMNQDAKVIEEEKVEVPKVHKTSINIAQLSPTRVLSYAEFPFAEIKSLSKQFSCSINDIAILLSSTALEHYFENTGEEIDFDLVAGMPISTRNPDQEDAVGNAVSVVRLSLYNQIKDLAKRLQSIMADTVLIKKTLGAKNENKDPSGIDGKAMEGLVSPIVLDSLIYGVLKMNILGRATLANVAITNVPGSPVQLYLAGCRLKTMIPMAPAVPSVGLTISITSTPQTLIIGFHSCGKAVSDKELLAEGARLGLVALKKAAGSAPKTGTKTKAKAKSKAASKTKAKAKPAAKAQARKKTSTK